MTRSCRDCPSFTAASNMLDVTKMTLGCDFCPTKGRVLTGPNFDDASNAQLCETIAENCDAYGLSRATTPVLTASLGIGNPMVSVQMTQKPAAANERPVVCTSCEWFVPANFVADELGYKAPLCSAKGRLLFPQKLIIEAANCGEGRNGPSTTSTQGVLLSDEYKRTYVPFTPIQVDPVAHTFQLTEEMERHQVDPRDYVTDKEVTAEDEYNFIRSWRKVEDPEGLHEPIFLPIFWGEKLAGIEPRDTYGGHRPDLYVDHQGLLYDMAVELLHNETPLLIGTAGTGKSEIGCWMAWLMDLPFDRIDVKKGTEAYHFIGETTLVADPDTGSTVMKFKKGRFAANYDKPGITMINEPNLVQAIFEFLRPVFDNAKQLGLDEAQGEIIERHQYRYIMCSQNPPWDPMYVGAEPLSAADIDRVSSIWVDLPAESIERAIITKHCRDSGYDIDSVMLDKVMQVAHDLRQQIKDGTLPIAWGLRAQIKVAKKTRFYSFEKAYRRAVMDGMEPEVVDAIMLSVRSVA